MKADADMGVQAQWQSRNGMGLPQTRRLLVTLLPRQLVWACRQNWHQHMVSVRWLFHVAISRVENDAGIHCVAV